MGYSEPLWSHQHNWGRLPVFGKCCFTMLQSGVARRRLHNGARVKPRSLLRGFSLGRLVPCCPLWFKLRSGVYSFQLWMSASGTYLQSSLRNLRLKTG